jgi:hypothetical protein
MFPILKVCAAGRDATETFFSLHRLEVLHESQSVHLHIGMVEGSEEQIKPRTAGEFSTVPYSEPS